MADAALAYRQAFLEGLRPELMGTVSEWADAHRVLTGEASAEPGPWRTSRTPYLREPMDCMSASSPVRRVVLVFGSQMGKTEVVLNSIGCNIHWRPGPMLFVEPTLDLLKKVNRQRLDPLLSQTPALVERVKPARSRDSGNTIFTKSFPGGVLMLVGANSATGLQSSPIQYLYADEVSSYPLEADDKGDPLENAEARTANFPRRKVLITSTPGEAEACRVTKEFESRSDQRRYHVPCPACGARQHLVWSQFKWDRPDADVLYECMHCGERFEERHKARFLPEGVWVPSAAGDGITAGFHLPSWYAPLGWLSWAEIRDQFVRAQTDRLLLKGWINKRAAQAWRDAIENQFNAEGLAKRRQDTDAGNGYPIGSVPDGVLVITAGVDVQGGGGSLGERLVVTIWGWGHGEEGWHLGHFEIHGDPQADEVWEQLDRISETQWKRDDDRLLQIAQGAIDDGGHATHKVREYCRTRTRWVPVKGSGQRGKAIIGKGSAVDINRKNQAMQKRSVLLYPIGTDTSISHLQGRLRNETPGPGYLHLGEAANDQFLAELFPWKKKPKMVKGFTQYEWILPAGEHDEAGDCTRYAYAALQLFSRRYNRATIWDQLERRLTASKPEPQPQPEVTPVDPILQRRKPQSKRRGNFVSGW
jgi:phage terminase large subunit GpA-like protein